MDTYSMLEYNRCGLELRTTKIKAGRKSSALAYDPSTLI